MVDSRKERGRYRDQYQFAVLDGVGGVELGLLGGDLDGELLGEGRALGSCLSLGSCLFLEHPELGQQRPGKRAVLSGVGGVELSLLGGDLGGELLGKGRTLSRELRGGLRLQHLELGQQRPGKLAVLSGVGGVDLGLLGGDLIGKGRTLSRELRGGLRLLSRESRELRGGLRLQHLELGQQRRGLYHQAVPGQKRVRATGGRVMHG